MVSRPVAAPAPLPTRRPGFAAPPRLLALALSCAAPSLGPLLGRAQAPEPPESSAPEWLNATAMAYAVHLAQYPRDVRAHLDAARALWRQGQRQQSRDHLLAAAKICPSCAEPHRLLAEVAEDLGDYSEAIVRLERFHRLERASADSLFRLGHLYLLHSDATRVVHPRWDAARAVVEARNQFARARTLDPENFLYHAAFAETYYAEPSPDWDAAERAWRACLPIAPNPEAIFAQLARVAFARGRRDEAEQLLARVSPEIAERVRRRSGMPPATPGNG